MSPEPDGGTLHAAEGLARALRVNASGKPRRRFPIFRSSISGWAKRVKRPPELAWRALQGAASEKYARALKDYAEEENDKLDSELKRRTLESNARQAKATADKLESEARMAQINEMDARLAFFDKLRQRNAVPVWDDQGNMTFARAPKDYDWDGLQDRMLRTGELPKLNERSDAPIKESGNA
jgi:hypothetical protein